jgi:hypothetical protein
MWREPLNSQRTIAGFKTSALLHRNPQRPIRFEEPLEARSYRLQILFHQDFRGGREN